MRTNATCATCGNAVRMARSTTGLLVMIDPLPVKDGVVWVDGYNVGGQMRVNIATHRDDVPRSEPLRYVLHKHQGDEWTAL